jgi:hypothetical protein
MPLSKVSHKLFSEALSSFNQARVKSLLDCVQGLVRGNELSLTAIGRHLSGNTKTKHKIKRVDRLLSNTSVHEEMPAFYQAISQCLLKGLPNYVIAIDWSGCCRDDYQLLRASLLYDGRSLPLLNMVVDKAYYNNNELHHQFLKQLADIVGDDKPTYILTDGGFKTPWFQLVKSFGWKFIGRVRGRVYGRLGNQDWRSVQSLYEGANTVPKYLGFGRLSKTQKSQCEAHFHLYKGKPKGRHKKRGHLLPLYASTEKRCKSLANEPWLIVTSDPTLSSKKIVHLYSKRMQIEQNFRDDKNQRYGFSWRNSFTSDANRIGVLCLLAFLATAMLWLIGIEAEKRKLHFSFQANSIKHRRVLSYLTLAKSLCIQMPRKLTEHYIERALNTFTQTYSKLSIT